jgi:hypothetical protein
MVEIGWRVESTRDGALWFGAFVAIGAILHEEARLKTGPYVGG